MRQSLSLRPTRTQWMVLTCMLLLLVNNGFIIIGITAFDPILLRTFNLSVTALKSRDLITLWSSGLIAPFIGFFADRFGVRPLFITGTLLLSAGMAAYSYVSSAPGLYVISVMLGASQACSGVVVAVIAISRWTNRHRGLAIGFAISGTSIGNAFVPQMNGWLIATLGWRHAFLALALMPLVLIPLILFVLDREEGRVRGDGGGAADATPATVSVYSQAIRSTNFLLLAATAGTAVFAVLGITTNIILYARALSLPAADTGTLLWAFFGMSLLAQLMGGYMGDRFGAQRILLVGLAMLAIGAIGLASPAYIPLALGVAVMGLGWGISIASLELFASILFAGPLFGRILGTLLMVETLAGGLGPVFVGNVYDRTGTFTLAFAGVGALCLVALALASRIQSGITGARTAATTPA